MILLWTPTSSSMEKMVLATQDNDIGAIHLECCLIESGILGG